MLIGLLLSLVFLGPFTVSGNFPRDLYGPVDTRMAGLVCAGGPCIWGNADSEVLPIKFHPPEGYRVRVLGLRGDLIAWIKTLPGGPVTPLESAAGVLVGFQTSSSKASPDCEYCADGCPLYLQDSVTEKQPKTRVPFLYENVDMLLDVDNVLNLKLAAYLNTTGKPIHLEGTYTVVFQFEPQQRL